METMEDNIYLGKKSNDESGYIFVPYIPMTIIPDNLEEIKNKVIQENRDRAIDSILEDKEYIPMTVEDHPDYKGFKPRKTISSRYSVKNINGNFYSTF